MTVRLRSSLESLPAYVPGRNVPGALKLASNETSYPPLPHVVERIATVAGQSNRYPDSFSVELAAAIAGRAGVEAAQVVVGAGSVSLCQQLVLATAGEGDEVLFGWRAFEAYPIVTTIGGADSVRVPLVEDTHDLTAMLAAVTERTRLVFVCNPNNPTGTAVAEPALREFLDGIDPQVVVVLDEAYREFVTDPAVPDGVTLLSDYPNLIVLRTFSKAYGLAGLRVGYGIAAHASLSDAVRQTQIPFAVPQLSQEAALACLEQEAERQLMDRVAEVTSERARVTAELRALGYRVPESQANFVWLGNGERAAGGIEATSFAAALEQQGVIVRAFADAGVRVTIGTPAENNRLLAAVAAVTA